MENNKEEYIFHIKYRDITIGCLAYAEKNFYLSLTGRNSENSKQGRVCFIPAFKLDEIYKSPELFDFFKNRIDNKNSDGIYKALTKYAGTAGRDGFSLEEFPERLVENKIQTLLEAYKIQEEKKKVQEARKSAESPSL